MARVNMQQRYWKMLHYSIGLAKKELDDKMEKIKAQIGNFQVAVLDSEYRQALNDYNRYDAIDALIQEAANKKDSPFSVGLGPDAPDPEPELSSAEEAHIRDIEQID